MRSRPGPGRGQARRRTATTCSSCVRPTRRDSPRPARSTVHQTPMASAGRGPAGVGSGHRKRTTDPCPTRRSVAVAVAIDASPKGSRPTSPLDTRRRRLPDLSALPPLLAATGTFAGLRERLGRIEDDPRRTGRHVGLVSVPHGAKTFLAATLAQGATGERLVWIARDAEIA